MSFNLVTKILAIVVIVMQHVEAALVTQIAVNLILNGDFESNPITNVTYSYMNISKWFSYTAFPGMPTPSPLDPTPSPSTSPTLSPSTQTPSSTILPQPPIPLEQTYYYSAQEMPSGYSGGSYSYSQDTPSGVLGGSYSYSYIYSSSFKRGDTLRSRLASNNHDQFSWGDSDDDTPPSVRRRLHLLKSNVIAVKSESNPSPRPSPAPTRAPSPGQGGTVLIKSTDYVWGGGKVPSGLYYIAIENSGSFISQRVSFPNTSVAYLLSFSARNRPSFSPLNTVLQVYVGGLRIFNQALTTRWNIYAFVFNIPSSQATVKFMTFFGSTSSLVPAAEVDNVILQVAPKSTARPTAKPTTRRPTAIPTAAPTVLHFFSGVANNIPVSSLSGWFVFRNTTYATVTNTSDVGACTGYDYTMLAATSSASPDILLVAAIAPTQDVQTRPFCGPWQSSAVSVSQTGPMAVTVSWFPNCVGALYMNNNLYEEAAASPVLITNLQVGSTYFWNLEGVHDWVWSSQALRIKQEGPTAAPTIAATVTGACGSWGSSSVTALQTGTQQVTLTWVPNCVGNLYSANSLLASNVASPFIVNNLLVGQGYSWYMEGTSDWVWNSPSLVVGPWSLPVPTVEPTTGASPAPTIESACAGWSSATVSLYQTGPGIVTLSWKPNCVGILYMDNSLYMENVSSPFQVADLTAGSTHFWELEGSADWVWDTGPHVIASWVPTSKPTPSPTRVMAPCLGWGSAAGKATQTGPSTVTVTWEPNCIGRLYLNDSLYWLNATSPVYVSDLAVGHAYTLELEGSTDWVWAAPAVTMVPWNSQGPLPGACAGWGSSQVTTSPISPNSVSLQWTPDCTGVLYMGDSVYATAATSPFVVSGLQGGRTYAFSLAGQSDWVWDINHFQEGSSSRRLTSWHSIPSTSAPTAESPTSPSTAASSHINRRLTSASPTSTWTSGFAQVTEFGSANVSQINKISIYELNVCNSLFWSWASSVVGRTNAWAKVIVTEEAEAAGWTPTFYIYADSLCATVIDTLNISIPATGPVQLRWLDAMPSRPSFEGVQWQLWSEPGCRGRIVKAEIFPIGSTCQDDGPLSDVIYTACSATTYSVQNFPSIGNTCSGSPRTLTVSNTLFCSRKQDLGEFSGYNQLVCTPPSTPPTAAPSPAPSTAASSTAAPSTAAPSPAPSHELTVGACRVLSRCRIMCGNGQIYNLTQVASVDGGQSKRYYEGASGGLTYGWSVPLCGVEPSVLPYLGFNTSLFAESAVLLWNSNPNYAISLGRYNQSSWAYANYNDVFALSVEYSDGHFCTAKKRISTTISLQCNPLFSFPDPVTTVTQSSPCEYTISMQSEEVCNIFSATATQAPTSAPTPAPTFSSTPIMWIQGPYGASCATTCSIIGHTCTDYAQWPHTPAQFQKMVNSSINLSSCSKPDWTSCPVSNCTFEYIGSYSPSEGEGLCLYGGGSGTCDETYAATRFCPCSAQGTPTFAPTPASLPSTARLLNGGYWYNFPGVAVGFADTSSIDIQVGEGDVHTPSDPMRLSWALDGINGGYRAGATHNLTHSDTYRKIILCGNTNGRYIPPPTFAPTNEPSAFPSVEPTPFPTTSTPSTEPTNSPTLSPTLSPTAEPTPLPTLEPSLSPTLSPTLYPTVSPTTRAPTTSPTLRPTLNPTLVPTLVPTVESSPTRRPSSQPTRQPSSQPSKRPSRHPSSQPNSHPTRLPSVQPSRQPLTKPSRQPSGQPTSSPIVRPTARPSRQPITHPSSQPTRQPSSRPIGQPSAQPVDAPSYRPTRQPSMQPSGRPTTHPTDHPTTHPSSKPSHQPTSRPSRQPTSQPTDQPSNQPISQPTTQPSSQPTSQPSCQPTAQPIMQPSAQPTSQPTKQPSVRPSSVPTRRPSTQPSDRPSAQPLRCPSTQPSVQPFSHPSTQPSRFPTSQPTSRPSQLPTCQPSLQPISYPSTQPSRLPSMQPSVQPQINPTTQPFARPSRQPSAQPTRQPFRCPTGQPSRQPVNRPTRQPTAQPSRRPSCLPSGKPSRQPTIQPSSQPSGQPSRHPSTRPSTQPSRHPTRQPSTQPTRQPSAQPSSSPISRPTSQPSITPTSTPTSQTLIVTPAPTPVQTTCPSTAPTSLPSIMPTDQPSSQPSVYPSERPSSHPTAKPHGHPTGRPSAQPILHPTSRPSHLPSAKPSRQPSRAPTAQPSDMPSRQPSDKPSRNPSSHPTSQPSRQPIKRPSSQPSCQPTSAPSLPTSQPSRSPSSQPTVFPSSQPSFQPTQAPSHLVVSTTIATIQVSQVVTGVSAAQCNNDPAFASVFQATVASTITGVQYVTVTIVSISDATNRRLDGSRAVARDAMALQGGGVAIAYTVSYASSTSSSTSSPVSSQLSSSVSSGSFTKKMQSIAKSKGSVLSSAASSTPPIATVPTYTTQIIQVGSPTSTPTGPSSQPSSQPTQPTSQPTVRPSIQPTNPSSQPTRQPSLQPSKQPSTQPTVVPTSPPTCGSGSFGPDGACQPCPPGYFTSSPAQLECLPCPINTFSSVEDSTSCTRCTYPFTNIAEASTTCLMVAMKPDGLHLIFGAAGLFSVYVIGVGYVKNVQISATVVAISIFSALDIYTDVLYVGLQTFSSFSLYGACLAFLILPNVLFFWRLIELGAMPDYFKIPFPLNRWSPTIWLTQRKGRPMYAVDPTIRIQPAFEEHDSFPKVAWYIIYWCVLIALQLVTIVISIAWAVMNFAVIMLAWFYVGVFLYQTKLMSVKSIASFWFEFWTGTKVFDEKCLRVPENEKPPSRVSRFLYSLYGPPPQADMVSVEAVTPAPTEGHEDEPNEGHADDHFDSDLDNEDGTEGRKRASSQAARPASRRHSTKPSDEVEAVKIRPIDKHGIDTRILNESFFAEMFIEAIPQILIQCTNNYYMNDWGGDFYIGTISIAFSFLILVAGCLWYLYTLVLCRDPFETWEVEDSEVTLLTKRMNENISKMERESKKIITGVKDEEIEVGEDPRFVAKATNLQLPFKSLNNELIEDVKKILKGREAGKYKIRITRGTVDFEVFEPTEWLSFRETDGNTSSDGINVASSLATASIEIREAMTTTTPGSHSGDINEQLDDNHEEHNDDWFASANA